MTHAYRLPIDRGADSLETCRPPFEHLRLPPLDDPVPEVPSRIGRPRRVASEDADLVLQQVDEVGDGLVSLS